MGQFLTLINNDMKDLKITKGEWDYFILDNKTTIETQNEDGNRCLIAELKYWEKEANAKLIAEAGTVANETGKTPRELYQSWCVTSAELSLKKSILISIENQNKVLSENFEAAKAVINDLNHQNKELLEALTGMINNTTQNFAEINGFGDQRTQAKKALKS